MDVRKMTGIALAVFGAWLLWGTVQALMFYTRQGADFGTAVIEPEFMVPGLRSAAALIGGLLALFVVRGGAVLASIATILTAILVAAVMAAGGDVSIWGGSALVLVVLMPLTVILITRPRNP